MKYCVITALGTSKRSYLKIKKTIHGTGQGSGESGSYWLFTSIPMMGTIEQNCEGCTTYSPDSKIKLVKHILDLVDDARQYTNDRNDNDIVQILNYFQEYSQIWEHLLNTTGEGGLEIPKCAIYTLEWDFDEHEIPFLKKITSYINIQSSETKTKQKMLHLSNDIPF